LVSVSPLGRLTARADFGDIRFTDQDGTTLLDYWMEEKVDGDYAVFWVKVPNIPASPNNATIYIYYGRADATTTSNGDKTFLFFDHFEGSYLDVSKWAGATSVTYSVEGSRLTITDVNAWSESQATGYNPLQNGFAVECRNVYYENVANGQVEFLASLMNDNWQWVMYAGYGDYWTASQSTAAYLAKIDSTSYMTSWNYVPSPSTHDFEIQKDQNNNTRIYLDEKLILGPVVSSTPFSHFLFTLYKRSGFNCSKAAIDAVIIRKYCNPEPPHGNWSTQSYSGQSEGKNVFSVVSNSTISDLMFNSTSLQLSFTVAGQSGTTGFAQITIAKTLVANTSNLKVYLDEQLINHSTTSTDESWIIYVTYTHSVHRITVALSPDVNPKPSSVGDLTIMAFVVGLFAVIFTFAVKRHSRRIRSPT